MERMGEDCNLGHKMWCINKTKLLACNSLLTHRHCFLQPQLLSMEEDDHRELQLLPTPFSSIPNVSSRSSDSSLVFRSSNEGPSLDLQLSISLRPIPESGCVEALKWQAAEQIRLAAMEKAYAERVRELTRREMELAQSEFARARLVWERAREEVEKAERMKERAIKKLDSSRMEITCQSCKQSLF